SQSRRMRNILIGVGVGAAIGLVTDQTIGRYLRNESNPAVARPLIWTLPIALCGGIGAASPSYPVIYQSRRLGVTVGDFGIYTAAGCCPHPGAALLKAAVGIAEG